jgi:diacylglycerol kinase (ATP)
MQATVTRVTDHHPDTPRRGAGPIQIIATPGSGAGRAWVRARELRDALRGHGHRARLKPFGDLDSLHRWATEDGAELSLLICIGGDGTHSAAAAAAIRRRIPFVPVPSGFGNLFARALGQQNRVDRVVGLLEEGVLVDVDVGVRNRELFLCQESFGLLSEIQLRAESMAVAPRARWRRYLAYHGAALRHLRETTLTPLQVTVDGRVVARDAVIVTVANVETYGAWLRLTPAASPLDGRFDVFAMTGASKRQILARLLRRHLRLPGADAGTLLRRGQRVSIVSSRSRDELEVIPRRLTVVVSRETAEMLERGRRRVDGGATPFPRRDAA